MDAKSQSEPTGQYYLVIYGLVLKKRIDALTRHMELLKEQAGRLMVRSAQLVNQAEAMQRQFTRRTYAKTTKRPRT